MTKTEEMAPKHVRNVSSSGGDGIGEHEDVSSDDSSSMRSRCCGRGEAPQPAAAGDAEVGGGESGGEGGNGGGRWGKAMGVVAHVLVAMGPVVRGTFQSEWEAEEEPPRPTSSVRPHHEVRLH